VIEKTPGHPDELAYGEIVAFRDGSADHVSLLRKGERKPSPYIAIPTPDEASRTAVLAQLIAHGIPRDEA